MAKRKKITLVTIMSSSIFLFTFIILGIYVGFYHKTFGQYFAPIAEFYSNLLQITVIPIISITIITTLTKLLTHGSSNGYVARIVTVFLAMVFVTGTVSVLAGYFLNPGKNLSSDPNIVKIVEEGGGSRTREVAINEPIEKVQNVSIVEFLVNTVPNNIFKALSTANMLQIIVFCVIFSVACGAISRKDNKARLSGIGDYLTVLHKINEKVLLFLPFGSFCLLATQLSNTSDSALATIFKLALTMLSVIISLTILCSIVLWRCSRKKYVETVKALFETLIMAFSTQSSMVCVPRAVKAMSEKLGFDKQTVELAVPLGVPLCQFSTICFYAIGSIFVVNIFNETLGFSGYCFIIFAAVLTSLAASGTKGMGYYLLMSGILAPLGLPLGNTVVLFIAVDPFVDPFGTMFHMYATCCSAAISCRLNDREKLKNKRKREKVVEGEVVKEIAAE